MPSACAAASPTSRRCASRDASCSAGHALGVFCEGTRQPSEEIGPVQPGAALIALAEGAPIVPVVIQGTIYIKQSLRHPVTVMFGPPLAVGADGAARKDLP